MSVDGLGFILYEVMKCLRVNRVAYSRYWDIDVITCSIDE